SARLSTVEPASWLAQSRDVGPHARERVVAVADRLHGGQMGAVFGVARGRGAVAVDSGGAMARRRPSRRSDLASSVVARGTGTCGPRDPKRRWILARRPCDGSIF